MVVIHNQDRGREKNISLKNDLIPARYRRPATNLATRTQDNLQLSAT